MPYLVFKQTCNDIKNQHPDVTGLLWADKVENDRECITCHDKGERN